jgi:hypothetical protein
VVYVGSLDGELYAFSASGTTNCSGTPTTCTPLWTAAAAVGVGGVPTPAIANGVVYVSSGAQKLYAFSASGTTNCSGTPTTCTPLWTAGSIYLPISSSAAVANGVVYVGSENGFYGLYAFTLPSSASLQDASSTQQYYLLNGSDGITWHAMDTSRLSDTFMPTMSGTAVLSANADLWTFNAGFNQEHRHLSRAWGGRYGHVSRG